MAVAPDRTEAAALEAAAGAAAVLRRWAAAVDSESRFPSESIDALRELELLGLLVPACMGGWEASCGTFVRVTQALASECLSTAMVWVMHCQQVAVIADHGPSGLRQAVLPEVAGGRLLLAGVTSEAAAGGGLLAVQSPARRGAGGVCFEREAPVVTAGARADAYLMTLRRSPESAPDDAILLYAGRDQVALDVTRPWTALGMRGTQSVGLRLAGCVPAGQVIEGDFRRAVLRTLVPVAHVGWSAAWLGAAAGVLRHVPRLLRRRAGPGGEGLADTALARLARLRMGMDAAGSLLWSVAREYQRARGAGAASAGGDGGLASAGFQIRVNELKVLASEVAHAAVSDAMDLVGVADGYAVSDRVPLERVYRDLRSASLMYSNDRLLKANGTLALMDTSLGAEPA